MALRKQLSTPYTPLYFLAALGNGGMAVTFFMYLMFLVPHPDTPIPTFDVLYPLLTGSNIPVIIGIVLALAGILVFAFRHFQALIWNIGQYRQFKQTPGYANLLQSNSEVALMAIPLTLAMSINVLFIMGALFVPGLWNVVEYLFPVALLGFAGVGAYALHVFGRFFTRILATGHFDCARNNNMSQMTAIFAFAMVGVGFAAPAAMSHNLTTVAFAMFGAIFFTSAAALLGAVKFVLGFRGMMQYGVDREASVSMWVIIPILTLVGITFIRLSHGLHHHLNMHIDTGMYFLLTSTFLSIQLLFGGIGYLVMRQLGYYREFVGGEGKSPGSYALICPGVALFVFAMFFIHIGLMKNGIITRFSPAHIVMILPLVALQFKTIAVMLRLDRKLLNERRETPPADPQMVGA